MHPNQCRKKKLLNYIDCGIHPGGVVKCDEIDVDIYTDQNFWLQSFSAD